MVKGDGEAFQEASALDVVVLDKTGTLTEGGNPKVTNYDIMASSEEGTKAIWAIVQALEESSNHPIATAIAGLCAEQIVLPYSTLLSKNFRDTASKVHLPSAHLSMTFSVKLPLAVKLLSLYLSRR